MDRGDLDLKPEPYKKYGESIWKVLKCSYGGG